jgi:hypothetical protein
MAYTPNFRQPLVPFGNLIPNVGSSDSVRPWTNSMVAEWLPLSDSSVNTTNGFIVYPDPTSGDYFVITPGKLVAYTRERISLDGLDGPTGRMVPAGVRIAWAEAADDADVLDYGTVDVTRRTQNLVTGQPVSAPVTYEKQEVVAGLVRRGLLRQGESLDAFISRPVGVVPMAQFEGPGGDSVQPRGLKFHNYRRQTKSQLLCDFVLALPNTPTAVVTTTAGAFADLISGTAATALGQLNSAAASSTAAGLWITPARFATMGLAARYGYTPTNADYVGVALRRNKLEVAPHLTFTWKDNAGVDKTATVLKRKVKHIDELRLAGDYMLDQELGIVWMFESGANALPANVASTDVISGQYIYGFSDVTSPLAHIRGIVNPGDLLVCDKWSNFAPYTPRPAEEAVGDDDAVLYVDPASYDRPEDIVGQALTFSAYPREEMAKVHTWYSNLPTGVLDKMPGSATGGFTDAQTYTGSGQFIILVNLLK